MELVESILKEPWARAPLVVRSSCLAEDQSTGSNAGKFETLSDVRGRAKLVAAIETVKASYGRDCENDQILIQPMLVDVEMSGVAFTIDPNSGAPYYVINFDDRSGRTDTVTSGAEVPLKTLYHFRHSPAPDDPILKKVTEVLDELIELFAVEHLDVEYCVSGHEIYVLQVRPLASEIPQVSTPASIRTVLCRLEENIRQRQGAQYGLCGRKTIFGTMPDWNPAEIIGERPRPLALSLYQELVTDSIWAYQRSNYGYRNLRSHPLMLSFCGLPYIDVRVSINSFIPEQIEEDLATRLVDDCIARLSESPHLHDKIEFEIVQTCYTLDTPTKIAELSGFRTSDREALQSSLHQLTNRILDHRSGLWRKDLARVVELEQRFERLISLEMSEINRAYWLLEECKRYGTLPFAGLARAGFIAIQLLNSFVSTGILDEVDRANFLNSLDTGSSQMGRDLVSMSRPEFLGKYGHLRPGCYDIRSCRYDEEPQRYFSDNPTTIPGHQRKSDFRLSLDQLSHLQAALDEHQIGNSVLAVFNFIRGAIEGREHAKFVFSKCVSEVLQILGQLGSRHEINRDDLSFLDIRMIRQLYGSCEDPVALIQRSIEVGKKEYEYTKSLRLPVLILDPKDIWSFQTFESVPNFVTSGEVQGPVRRATEPPENLRASIVMIPSADPGYDWIFSCGIAGFITKYGGVNSHMAIRAAELGIPAAIGVGEQNYALWQKAQQIRMNCENGSIWPIEVGN